MYINIFVALFSNNFDFFSIDDGNVLYKSWFHYK